MRVTKNRIGLLAGVLAISLLGACGGQTQKSKVLPLNNSDHKIINGDEAEVGAYPFMASLHASFFGGHFCGASLIHEQYLLTAGHCTTWLSPNTAKIILGMHDRNNMSGAYHAAIEAIIDHPLYDGNVNYDFALIKLREPVDTNRFPVVRLNREELLIPHSENSTPRMSTVMGWGTTENGDLSTVLMEVDLPLVTREQCEVAYPNELTEAMMCAGYREGGFDSCQGDSGGPLILQENGEPLLIGTVSWGEGCALENKYGVYGKVSLIVDWIDDVIAGRHNLEPSK